MKILIVLSLFFVFTGTLSAQTIDKIVAFVNEEIITQTDVDRVLATIAAEYKSIYSDSQEYAQRLNQAKKSIIGQMVEEKLVLSEAKKFDIKVEEDKIEARIEQIRKSFPNEEDFEQTLEVQGLTLKDLRDRFRNQEIMKKAVDYFVRYDIKVKPREMELFFESHQQEFLQPEKARIRSILIKVDEALPFEKGLGESSDKDEALQRTKKVVEQLRKGDDFEDLVKRYSQGANAEDGGDLGFIEKGQMLKEIDEAIFSLQPGEFTDAIKTPSGYRIFKLEEKRPQKQFSFSEVQDSIEKRLYKEKFAQAFKEWIEKLKQNAYILIKEEAIDE